MTIRTQLKAGKRAEKHNHNETLQTKSGLKAGGIRRAVLTTVRKEDRLDLMVVRAGLRAGARRPKFAR